MAKTDEVLIEVRPGRVRTALINAGRLVELIVEDETRPSVVGNIYLGRIEKVIESLNAAFVDLGLNRSGFLALAEARPRNTGGDSKSSISKYLREGEKVVVQVLRDPFEDKGPKLTTHVALTARTVILTPGDPAIRISRQIENKEIRTRQENLLKELAGPEEGFIVRTAAQKASDDDILADVTALRDAWSKVLVKFEATSSPFLLFGEPDGVLKALRDLVPADARRVVIDDVSAYVRASAHLEKQAPALLDRLIHHKETSPLFASEELLENIDQALSARVELPSGGSLIFSETPALVAIDVNVAGASAGGREQSALKTNLEAAVEIARQIRLRNLSGLLVIDFISMKKRDNGTKVLEILVHDVADDPNQVFVGGFTRFGLVEMTRKRTRQSLASSLGASCQACSGSGAGPSAQTIAYQALDRLAVEAGADPSQKLELITSESVAVALKGPVNKALSAFEERLGFRVTINIDADLRGEGFEVVRDVSK